MMEKIGTQGIIFIVGVYGADGTATDVENVESTFLGLNFVTFIEKDPTTDEIACLMEAAAECDYPYRYKYIAFYFAGHGGRDDAGKPFVRGLHLDDANPEILDIYEYIVTPLRKIDHLTRLFFFDCCQSPGSGTAYCNNLSRDKGSIIKKSKPHPGEVIAYATSEGQKSVGDRKRGGLWTYHLCRNLRMTDPITTVLANTYDDVVKEKKKFQEPMVISKVGMVVLGEGTSLSQKFLDTGNKDIDQPVNSRFDSFLSTTTGKIDKSQTYSGMYNEEEKLISVPEFLLWKQPEKRDVYDILKQKSESWNDFAIEFNLDKDIYDLLYRKRNAWSDNAKLDEVLDHWIQSQCSDVTWKTVLDVLKKLQLNDVAMEVQNFLTRSDVIDKYKNK